MHRRVTHVLFMSTELRAEVQVLRARHDMFPTTQLKSFVVAAIDHALTNFESVWLQPPRLTRIQECQSCVKL